MSHFWATVAGNATVVVPCVVAGRLVLWWEMRRPVGGADERPGEDS